MPEPDRNKVQRRADTVPLSPTEKRDVIDRMNALEGRPKSFVAEIARQATAARGRMDDDVYGIVRVTLQALDENAGQPPPLVFAVTHHETGDVRQVGFLPPGATGIGPGGRFETNDPRHQPRDRLAPPPPPVDGARDG